MRSALTALLAAVLLAAGYASTTRAPTPAATVTDEAAGVVLLVRTERHLEVALRTAAELRAARPREVHVLVCGDAVTAVRRAGALAGSIEEAVARGTRVVACGLSLTEQQVAPDDLLPSVEVVPNALVEAVGLQDRGFRSIEL